MTDQRVSRRLAAILAADIAGYARLMGEDEAATVRDLKAHQGVLLPLVVQFGGRVIDTAGDGILAEFPSVVGALECAVRIQQLMADRNLGMVESRRMLLRIGINLGEVIHDEARIYGDGINIAARLEAIAEPGGICISAKVHEEVEGKLELNFVDLGAQELKNIARPVRVYALAGSGAGPAAGRVTEARPAATAPVAPPLSIAVLPFVNMSGNQDNEYFADGLSEELLNLLSRIKGLRVASRTSAFSFKGKNVDLPTAARKLGVAHILEGSVRQSGQRVRISAQLIQVSTDSQLWSETFDRTLEDIFAVQDDIAQAVLRELRNTLLGGQADSMASGQVRAEVAQAAQGRGQDAEAHRLYLQGRYFSDRRDRAELANGIGYLKEALALEPDFALAWAELGLAYAKQVGLGWAPVAEGYANARDAVRRALALQPDLVEGHAGLGRIQNLHDWDWRGAQASYQRALELAPCNVLALQGAGTIARSLGRLDDSIAFYRRALEQDPLNAWAYSSLGWSLRAADQLAEAEQAYRKALELAPQGAGTRGYLALVVLAQGRVEEALAQALREPEQWHRWGALAMIHHAAGNTAQSDQALREIVDNAAAQAACQIAEVQAMRGQSDFAFDWLQRAYLQRDPGLAGVKTSAYLRSLHGDPRWAAFLRKMGLAD